MYAYMHAMLISRLPLAIKIRRRGKRSLFSAEAFTNTRCLASSYGSCIVTQLRSTTVEDKVVKEGGGEVGDCTWRLATQLAQYRSHWQPAVSLSATWTHCWLHSRRDKRIPSKRTQNYVCGKLSRWFPLYLLGKRPIARSTLPSKRYAGKGLSRLFPVVHHGGLSLHNLLPSHHRERREKRSG